MTKRNILCRKCKERFLIDNDGKDIEWVMPSKNWYYHKKCYDDWKAGVVDDSAVAASKSEDEWISLIYDFIARDLKGNYNYMQCEAQRKKCVKDGMTNKGIYFTMYYCFIIKKGNWKSEYGLGLVPHVYEEATSYWTRRQNATAGLMESMEKLIREKAAAEPIQVKKASKKKKQIKAPE